MKNRVFLLILAALMLLTAGFLPRTKSSSVKPSYQHESWPQETEKTDGFQPDGSLRSHLPLIILHTEGYTVPGEDYKDSSELLCAYSVINNPGGVNCSDGEPQLRGRVQLSIRGNSSRYLPKKQYSMKLVDAQGLPEDKGLLGMPPESNWVLNGSYIDHSLIRNYTAYTIAGEIMEYAPQTRLCEVFLTDSEGNAQYQGVYTLIEKPKVSEQRLNLPPYNPNIAESSYLVQMNARFDETTGEYVNNNPIRNISPDNIQTEKLEVVYPGEDEITRETMEYIQRENYIFNRVLYDSIHVDDWERVEQYLDVDSFVDYYLINEFFQNFDAGRLSTYSYKSFGGKIHMGPVWDFDGAFNNFHSSIDVDRLGMQQAYYFGLLLQNEEFAKLSVQRYRQLRRGSLSDEHLLDFIDGAAEYLESPALRNSQLWYGSNEKFLRDIRDMKSFVIERGKWMDENFASMILLDK